ncbi:hypothetical protein M408DRAFT_330764 [Serendipita vermifera MAFF 305830]|uniref:Phospholipid/glycerol acyltransferase domain-containing protein n=1 Tax=Serendipita vermifera MAFF 305830 TaxID=933852 RepID=A0A0C3B208_SERVB|nr:hypothetical protein M408DRAFT_330764 [Serendipita vermifera MAFF 305830]
MPVGYIHFFLRKVASLALSGFFREIHVIGEENVPKDGPLIVVCTHHNMMIDPGILSNTMPDLRPVHYWAKASLFGHPIARKILLASGVIPVDRGSKDNQKLFAGTFSALSQDDAVALFPEGTSYTLPRIVQVKDGASWSALEYVKWVADGGENVNNGKELVIVPAGITYTDKGKYRSSAVIEYGPPIHISEFKKRFLSGKEGESKAAVKALTHAIEQGMIELTINAPNWEALLAARTARDLLWESWRGVKLNDFRPVGQTLVDLFSTPWDSDPAFISLKRALITYHSLLKSSNLTNGALASLPLPRTKHAQGAKGPLPIPSRLSTVLPLLQETFNVLIRLPLFLVPLLVHWPIYSLTRWVGDRSSREEETMAQNKVVVGLAALFSIYTFWFWVIFALFWSTPMGAVVALITICAMEFYHSKLIDDNYIRAKRLLSAYRILVGVWGPQKWDMSLSALSQYTMTQPPPPNPYLKLPDNLKAALMRNTSDPSVPTVNSLDAKVSGAGNSTLTQTTASKSEPAIASSTKSDKRVRNKRPPSRKLIRHLLRARVDATRQLAAFLRRIDRPDVKVAASAFMASVYGGGQETLFEKTGVDAHVLTSDGKEVPGAMGTEVDLNPTGWRYGQEVVRYLRSKGANVGKLLREAEGISGGDGEVEGEYDFVALSSDGEASPGSPDSGYGASTEKADKLEWVAPKKK